MKTLILALLFILLTSGTVTGQDATLIVDASVSEGTISPYVYSAGYGPWALVSPEMAPLAAESGVPLLRFPGGNWGDQHDIRPD